MDEDDDLLHGRIAVFLTKAIANIHVILYRARQVINRYFPQILHGSTI